jgi:hypothetical protein
MARHLMIYTTLTEMELALKLEAHQEEFEVLLGDTFSEDELEGMERQLETLASIEAQPLLDAVSFSDLTAKSGEEELQERFFTRCRSCLCLENLPYLETHPLQVTYLIDLMWMFDEALVETPGGESVLFKQDFLQELKPLSNVESLLRKTPLPPRPSAPVESPVDFVLRDIHREVARLAGAIVEVPDRFAVLWPLVQDTSLDTHTLLQRSGLHPKDFGDRLESLKFFLKKL